MLSIHWNVTIQLKLPFGHQIELLGMLMVSMHIFSRLLGWHLGLRTSRTRSSMWCWTRHPDWRERKTWRSMRRRECSRTRLKRSEKITLKVISTAIFFTELKSYNSSLHYYFAKLLVIVVQPNSIFWTESSEITSCHRLSLGKRKNNYFNVC